MRLVLDMMGAQSASRNRGIGRYSNGLTQALLAEARGHEILLAVCDDMHESAAHIRADFPDLESTGRIVGYRTLKSVAAINRMNAWRQQAGAAIRDAAFAALEPDAILSLSVFEGYAEDALTSGLKLAKPALRAAIAYDVIPLRFRKDYLDDPRVDAWYRAKLIDFEEHDLFLAISDATADDLHTLLKIDRSRIKTIFAGAEELNRIEAAPSHALVERFGLKQPYFVYAGSWEPRKNFLNLVEAFGQFKRSTGANHLLVLVTDDSPATKRAVEIALSAAGLKKTDVVVTGYIGDAELRRLYCDAHAMVYPSLCEGFGLPILEAMFCDIPVVCSSTSSMREIISLDEAMFDPERPDNIAATMMRLATDDAYRSRLVEHGRKRRQAFSWRDSAQRLWLALETALATHDVRPTRRERWSRHQGLLRYLAQISQETDVVPSVRDINNTSEAIAANLEIYDVAPRTSSRDKRWRIEGPVDSSYSLALVNRETVRALVRQGVEASVVSSEGGGDFSPDLSYLKEGHGDIAGLLRPERDEPQGRALIVSRNMYPPRVKDMDGDYNMLHHCAWEESRYPSPWVDDLNLYLDGATCLSKHVQKVLQDSGVTIPLATSGCGVDHWLGITAQKGIIWPGKSFRFLHVSSCFPRKGVDALLEAFGKAFRGSDDVSLIIKTFDNPHNSIAAQLEDLREADAGYPDVHVIFGDFAPERLKSLYEHCHVMVAPSRAEGYGLPIAEAMLSGLPPIVTGWSGQLDFCRPEWAWIVDYHFTPAETHFGLAGSVWADPVIDDLATNLGTAAATTTEERAKMTSLGREHLLREHTWDAVTQRLRKTTDAIIEFKRPAPARIGWVTTWNCACGIATYSQHFIEQVTNEVVIFGAHNDERIASDENNVIRCWRKSSDAEDLCELGHAVLDSGIDALVIQFNYGFYNFRSFSTFLVRMSEAGVSVFVDFHATRDPENQPDRRLGTIVEALSTCARVIVHSHHDLNRLKAINVVDNACLIPHGILTGPDASFVPHANDRFVLGSYGFCLPHKGLIQLVDAFALLAATDPTVELKLVNAAYPADVSRRMVQDIDARIHTLGLRERAKLTPRFLNDEEAMAKISACDLLVFPYEATNESASGAVRFALSSGRPVATTPIPIFDDVSDVTFQVSACDPADLSQELASLIALLRKGGDTIDTKYAASNRWRSEHSYKQIGAQLAGLVQAVLVEKQMSAAMKT